MVEAPIGNNYHTDGLEVEVEPEAVPNEGVIRVLELLTSIKKQRKILSQSLSSAARNIKPSSEMNGEGITIINCESRLSERPIAPGRKPLSPRNKHIGGHDSQQMASSLRDERDELIGQLRKQLSNYTDAIGSSSGLPASFTKSLENQENAARLKAQKAVVDLTLIDEDMLSYIDNRDDLQKGTKTEVHSSSLEYRSRNNDVKTPSEEHKIPKSSKKLQDASWIKEPKEEELNSEARENPPCSLTVLAREKKNQSIHDGNPKAEVKGRRKSLSDDVSWIKKEGIENHTVEKRQGVDRSWIAKGNKEKPEKPSNGPGFVKKLSTNSADSWIKRDKEEHESTMDVLHSTQEVKLLWVKKGNLETSSVKSSNSRASSITKSEPSSGNSQKERDKTSSATKSASLIHSLEDQEVSSGKKKSSIINASALKGEESMSSPLINAPKVLSLQNTFEQNALKKRTAEAASWITHDLVHKRQSMNVNYTANSSRNKKDVPATKRSLTDSSWIKKEPCEVEEEEQKEPREDIATQQLIHQPSQKSQRLLHDEHLRRQPEKSFCEIKGTIDGIDSARKRFCPASNRFTASVLVSAKASDVPTAPGEPRAQRLTISVDKDFDDNDDEDEDQFEAQRSLRVKASFNRYGDICKSQGWHSPPQRMRAARQFFEGKGKLNSKITNRMSRKDPSQSPKISSIIEKIQKIHVDEVYDEPGALTFDKERMLAEEVRSMSIGSPSSSDSESTLYEFEYGDAPNFSLIDADQHDLHNITYAYGDGDHSLVRREDRKDVDTDYEGDDDYDEDDDGSTCKIENYHQAGFRSFHDTKPWSKPGGASEAFSSMKIVSIAPRKDNAHTATNFSMGPPGAPSRRAENTVGRDHLFTTSNSQPTDEGSEGSADPIFQVSDGADTKVARGLLGLLSKARGDELAVDEQKLGKSMFRMMKQTAASSSSFSSKNDKDESEYANEDGTLDYVIDDLCSNAISSITRSVASNHGEISQKSSGSKPASSLNVLNAFFKVARKLQKKKRRRGKSRRARSMSNRPQAAKKIPKHGSMQQQSTKTAKSVSILASEVQLWPHFLQPDQQGTAPPVVPTSATTVSIRDNSRLSTYGGLVSSRRTKALDASVPTLQSLASW